MRRGPQRSPVRRGPARASMRLQRCAAVPAASSRVSSPATALTKSGCAIGPSGRVRYSGERSTRRRIRQLRERLERARDLRAADRRDCCRAPTYAGSQRCVRHERGRRVTPRRRRRRRGRAAGACARHRLAGAAARRSAIRSSAGISWMSRPPVGERRIDLAGRGAQQQEIVGGAEARMLEQPQRAAAARRSKRGCSATISRIGSEKRFGIAMPPHLAREHRVARREHDAADRRGSGPSAAPASRRIAGQSSTANRNVGVTACRRARARRCSTAEPQQPRAAATAGALAAARTSTSGNRCSSRPWRTAARTTASPRAGQEQLQRLVEQPRRRHAVEQYASR